MHYALLGPNKFLIHSDQTWQWSVGHGQIGQQIWMGHMGHGSVSVTHWPTSKSVKCQQPHKDLIMSSALLR